MDEVAVIIASIAWHVSTEADFRKCLEGFESFTLGQTKAPDVFIVSWSAPPEIYELVLNELDKKRVVWEGGMNNTKFALLPYSGRLKQFEHYDRVNKFIKQDGLAPHDNTWMVFGDADDKWLAGRIEVMASFLDSYPDKTVLLFNSDGAIGKFEYWQGLTRYDVFSSFFDRATVGHLKSTYCDLAFDAHLSQQGEKFQVIPNLNDSLYIKVGTGHLKQFEHQSFRLDCVQYIDIKLMRQFPCALEPWAVWGQDDVDRYELRQPFNLREPLHADQLEHLWDHADETSVFQQTFKPMCGNTKACQASVTLQCTQCHSAHYCCTECQEAMVKHKWDCGYFKMLKSKGIHCGIFSVNFNHTHALVKKATGYF